MTLSRYKCDVGVSEAISYTHCMDDTPNPNHFPRHCHDGYELIYVSQGDGSYVVEGEEYSLGTRSLLLMPPHAFHHVKIDFSKPYERYIVNFKGSALPIEVRDALDRMFEDMDRYGRFYGGADIPEGVVPALLCMEETPRLSAEDAKCYVVSLLSSILLRLSLDAPALPAGEQSALGARVVRYLNAHLTEDISLDVLAKNFFVSKFHLCRAFKEHNGVSVLQYLTEKRVMYAKHLVELGEAANHAAAKAGFGDYSSFYRAHRRICGTAPRESKHTPASLANYGMKGAHHESGR